EVEEHIVRQAMPAPQRQAKGPRPAVAPSAAASQEDYLLGWLLRYPAVATAVQEKIRRDLLPFPLVEEIIQGTPLELFERFDNRAIWRAWLTQPAGTNVEEWAQTLDEALREQAERVLHLGPPQSQAYRIVNDAPECARMLQLRHARKWKKRISEQ